MSDFTLKKGDSLSELEVRLIDRKAKPLDLTTATSVLLYMRLYGGSTNTVNGVACPIQAVSGDETYKQRVLGPDISADTVGRYTAYFKVLYGAVPKRIPSKGHYTIEVEASLE